MIITDEKLLRPKCIDVLPEEINDLRSILEKELNQSNNTGSSGIGLACPQIGINKNFAIVRLGKDSHNDLNVDLVNAKISHKYDLQTFENEGCLSFPGRFEKTKRFQEIHITDNLVHPYNFIATGLFAVVIQHELDHLSGILLPDVALAKNQVVLSKKIKPNEPCPCNSGKKFKKCCWK